MTEPDRDDAAQPEEEGAESRFDAALEAFKPRHQTADSSLVSESGRSGMTWSPVTDTGTGGDTETDPDTEARHRSSFQFDLGSALARLGGVAEPPSTERDVVADGTSTESLPVRSRHADPAPDDPAAPTPRDHADGPSPLPSRGRTEPSDAEPLPTRGRPDPSDAAAAPEPPSVVDRLPTRTPRSEPPTDEQPDELDRRSPELERPAGRPQPASRSVFDDANPTPTLPAAGAPTLPSQLPTPPSGKVTPAGDGSVVPFLPASMPAAPPLVIAPIESAPSTPELNALRSAQLRANRNDRQGKLFGRSLLALIVVGGLVAAALLFGRAYLFPTEWDPELTPLVDEIQSARGAEFDDTVPMVERAATEYAPLVTAHVLGADWNTRLPEWRALGLAAGDGAVADVQVRVATLYPAFFDADSDTIVVSADRSADSREPALRLALETVLASQLNGDDEADSSPLGLTGLEPIERTARRAADAAAAGLVAAAPDALAELGGVPVPVAYQLRAIDSIGPALIDVSTRPLDPLPAAVDRLDDDATTTVGGLRQPDDQQVLEPVALGADDWAMIWGARLSPAIVGPMANSLVADSYSVVSRSGVTCSIAVFETGTDGSGASLLADLTRWAGAAPAAARASATPLAPNRVQLEACDPGADAASSSVTGAVDLVVRRQLDRLTAG